MKSIATIATLDTQSLRSLLFHLNRETYTLQFVGSLLRAVTAPDQTTGKKFMSVLWKMRFSIGNPMGNRLLRELFSFVFQGCNFRCSNHGLAWYMTGCAMVPLRIWMTAMTFSFPKTKVCTFKMTVRGLQNMSLQMMFQNFFHLKMQKRFMWVIYHRS